MNEILSNGRIEWLAQRVAKDENVQEFALDLEAINWDELDSMTVPGQPAQQ